ncbi:NAD kinase [Canibacter zhuwentaonis]|uniref:NAD kinase n=1 Tax=Canibacter zhuwentaonis TaxID=2837491 RepID=UPI0032B48042
MSAHKSRKILVISHIERAEAIAATCETVSALVAHHVVPVMVAADRDAFAPHIATSQIAVLGADVQLAELEIAIVLGGDGTILRAAELVHDSHCPVVGVNLGHVGFLAEKEHRDLTETLELVLQRDYRVEKRKLLEVKVFDGADVVHETFAVNEATVEKTVRMIEVAIGVDDRPLLAFGCDGVVMATATGSTAYAFSAGGPVVWPSVDAMLLVPIAAHALFNRPLVVGPEQVLEAQLLPNTLAPAQLWCDGRRKYELVPGQRVAVRRSAQTLQLARLHEGVFTDRLVNKFKLPIESWRQTGQERG